METVTVYNFEGFSITEGRTINHGTYATMEFIVTNKLTPFLDRKLEVPITHLNGDGQYIETAP